jgi:hypothetical protein
MLRGAEVDRAANKFDVIPKSRALYNLRSLLLYSGSPSRVRSRDQDMNSEPPFLRCFTFNGQRDDTKLRRATQVAGVNPATKSKAFNYRI